MELLENSNNPQNDINLKIDSIIDMTLRKKIPWTTLAIMLNELTPTLEISKQVIKVLLHNLETLSNKQKFMVNQHAELPVLEESKIQVDADDIEQDQVQHENLEIADRNVANTKMPLHLQDKIEKFQCDVCAKSFIKLGSLKKHEKIHTFRKTFMCKTCSKCFNTSWELKVHERSHSGYRPHQCKICSKTFTQLYILKRHEEIHTTAKKFKCETCAKSFLKKTNLIRHENSHKGIKSFKCNVCNKNLATKVGLTNHEKIHTGEKPHQCNMCSKSFIDKYKLLKHGKTHNKNKLYKC